MSRWGRSAVLVVALLTVGQLACSGCSESSDGLPGQGGSGGVAQDAPTETMVDAPKDRVDGDAPGDSAKDQATEDVEASPDGGLWEPSPYAAFLQCPIEQLVDPALVPPYPWLDCEGMPTACKMLDTSSLVGTSGYTLTFVGRVGGSENPRFAVIRGIGADRFSPTLFRRDGSIAAAWTYTLSGGCVTRIAWIGDDEIAVYISPKDSAIQPLNVAWRVLVGSPAAILAGTAEQYDLKFDEFNLNAIEQLSVSETLVVTDGQPGGRMFVAERPDGSFEEVPQPGALWSKHLLVGSEVIAAGFEGKGNLYVRHADGGVEPFRAAPDRAEAYPGGTFQTLAWQEGVNGSLTGGYETMEVWSAPFTTNPAELAPKKLMDLPNSTHISPANGEGWYVVPIEPIHAASNSPVRLIQLSTGKYIDLPPPTGHAYTEMVGVAGGEAWFLLRKFPGSKDPVTIARVDLSGLEGLLQ